MRHFEIVTEVKIDDDGNITFNQRQAKELFGNNGTNQIRKKEKEDVICELIVEVMGDVPYMSVWRLAKRITSRYQRARYPTNYRRIKNALSARGVKCCGRVLMLGERNNVCGVKSLVVFNEPDTADFLA